MTKWGKILLLNFCLKWRRTLDEAHKVWFKLLLNPFKWQDNFILIKSTIIIDSLEGGLHVSNKLENGLLIELIDLIFKFLIFYSLKFTVEFIEKLNVVDCDVEGLDILQIWNFRVVNTIEIMKDMILNPIVFVVEIRFKYFVREQRWFIIL